MCREVRARRAEPAVGPAGSTKRQVRDLGLHRGAEDGNRSRAMSSDIIDAAFDGLLGVRPRPSSRTRAGG
ncbi:hypothetical protein GCM10022244_16320 [Streptomyces gulbargensis]|uniref:Uncharacterized protein n=1 Tax=Streptomyces gulbargensis TaxID=364901 RepID=A0ABP7LT89_9ACTN